MENNNIRTMKFVGKDDWERPVYKCIENNILWKDLSSNPDKPDLYSCQNSFDGEPDCPINPNLEIVYKTKYVEDINRFKYMMLGRLQSDCDYYLGNGGGYSGALRGKDVQSQIARMKEIWNELPEDAKPEWLSMEQIEEYEKKMVVVEKEEVEKC